MQPLISFDRAVDYYDQTRGFPPGIAGQVVRAAAAFLNPGDRLLEIGIGTGRIAKPLAELGYTLFGLDVSMRMMQRLRETLPAGAPRPHLILADAARLPWMAGSFDAVLAVHVFHLIPLWQEALREISRVLKPGGLLLHGTDWRPPDSPSQRLRTRWNEILQAHGYGDQNRPRLKKIRGYLEAAGAEMTEVAAAAWEESFNINQHLDRLAQAMYSSVWHVPSDQLPAYVEELRAWARQEYGDLERDYASPHTFSWQVFTWKGSA
jgi:ubiquinone/menaquinone biosynthesis C-methylase UbiE